MAALNFGAQAACASGHGCRDTLLGAAADLQAWVSKLWHQLTLISKGLVHCGRSAASLQL